MIDICVFAGRMRPFTDAHLYNIRQGLASAQYVVVLVGSTNEPINFRNPFTFPEVREMIRASLTPQEADRVFIFGIEDQDTDPKWVIEVQRQINALIKRLSFGHEPTVSLIGHSKDDSSYYLEMFPQWGAINTENFGDNLSATDVRETLYLAAFHDQELADMTLPRGTALFLREWVDTPAFAEMREEFFADRNERRKFQPHPYNDWHWHECADAVAIQSGAVLLVKRGFAPGKGLWALPGGHRQLERFRETALRELCEETGLDEFNPHLSKEVLRTLIWGEKLCDDPWRSTRMVTTSVAYGFRIPGTTRPIVKGQDDAAEARWWNLDEVTREMMFEDHFVILRHFADRFDTF